MSQSSPATIRHSFTTPTGFTRDKSHWAFDETFGRHYFTSLNRILVTDRDGVSIKSWDISESENREAFSDAHGSNQDGALFIHNESTFYVLDSDRITMTVWQFTDLNDGKGEVTLNQTLDFSLILPTAGAIGIDRALDGGWWIISEGALYRTNPTGTAIRRSITFEELGEKLFESGTPPFRPELIAVDQTSGDLYLYYDRAGSENHLRERFYRIDEESLLQEGRFMMNSDSFIAQTFSTRSRIMGSADGFVMNRQLFPTIIELGLEPQELPDMTSISFDREGVLWTYCHSFFRNIEVTMGVNWGAGAGPSRVYDPAPVSIGNSPLISAQEAVFSFPASNLNELPPFFEDLILLQNDNDQLSTPIPITLPLAAYNGPVMFSQTCPEFSSFSEVVTNKVTTWTWSGVAPKEPFNGWVEFADYVPWVGGKRYGIADIQATGKAVLSSKDDGSVSVAGGGSFLLGPGKLRTEFGGGVLQNLTPEGPEVTGGLLTMKVEGSVPQEAGLIEVFPQLAPLKSVAFIGSSLIWLDKRAKLTATIGVGLDSSTKVKLSEENDLQFDGQITGFLSLGVAAAVNLINGFAEVSAYGQGKGSVTIIPSSEGLKVDNISLTALVGAKIRAYLLERSVQRVVSISSKDGVVVSKALPRDGFVSDSGWQYAYGDEAGRSVRSLKTMPYVLSENPFEEMKRSRPRTSRKAGTLAVDREVRVLAGIPADAVLRATSSPVDDKIMVVWSQPIPGNPSTQATDVWFSYFDGTTFSDPQPILSDVRADFNPKVAYHSFTPIDQRDHVWIAAWERNSPEGLMPTGDPQADTESIIADLRPCWSWFDPLTRTWSEPVDLPLQGKNAFNIQLINSGTGRRAGIAWLESETGAMYPWDLNAATPSQGRIGGIRLRYQPLFYQRGQNDVVASEAIRTLGDEDPDAGIPDDIVEYSIASDQRIGGATEIVVLITRLMSVASVEPFIPTMRIESWGEPGFGFVGGLEMKLKSFDDNVPVASNPQVQIKENVRTSAIIKGSDFLLGSHQQGGGTPPLPQGGIRTTYEKVEFADDDPFKPQGAEFQSYSLASFPDPNGSGPGKENNPPRVVIFQKPDEEGHLKLHLAGPLRKMGPITYGSATDRQASAILASDGTLLTMYQQVPITKTATTTSKLLGTLDDEPLIQIEEEELGFFAISRRMIVANLAAGEIRLRSGYLRKGETVTLEAEIYNNGDLPISDARISLYAVPDDKNAAGSDPITILENKIAGPYQSFRLSGNDSVVDTVDWIVPDDQPYTFFLVVDPDNEIEEFDETDNMSENTIPQGIPTEIIEWLLGRYSGDSSELDSNKDGVIDAGDI